jgi:ABC-type transporter Mla maintaining outer membrane lipid asymmetry permease subunit MlaE
MQDTGLAEAPATGIPEFLYHWYWMGPGSLPMVLFQSIFVSLALTAQAVRELDRFNAQDLSGAVIIIGLLRDLGPLIVGLAWASRTAAFISMEPSEFLAEGWTHFLLPRYGAAVCAALPLCAFGLAISGLTAALYAPVFGVSSTADFLESARQIITTKDVSSFFFKMIVVNPAVGVFVGATCIARAREPAPHAVAHAVAAAIIVGGFFDWVVTTMFFLH